jgi:hypothetical protein
MSIYKLRVQETLVAAQQWTAATDTVDDPVSLETNPDGTKFGLLHTHDAGVLRVNDGDFIINHAKDAEGVAKWSCLNPADFNAKYEQAHPNEVPEKASKKLAAKAGE